MTDDATPREVGSHAGLGPAPEQAARAALHEFRQQDDYLLAHGASLMSEHSHEILHVDTLRRIVDAAVAAERKRWERAAEAMAQEADHKFTMDGTVAHWLRALVAKRMA